MPSDSELLQGYVERHDQKAFEGIISRYVNLVYATALRISGNASAAEDIAQVTFSHFAQKAEQIRMESTLAGWLYAQTRYVALQHLREERRRNLREKVAGMTQTQTTEDVTWNDVAPLLDEGIATLDASDRQAIVLRFLQGLSFKVVGLELGIKEDAARMRVNRSLEKLRAFLKERGIASSTAGLLALLTTNAAHSAPGTLLPKLLALSTVPLGLKTAVPLIIMNNLKVAVTSIALVATIGTIALLQRRENKVLRQNYAALETALENERGENLQRFQALENQLHELKSRPVSYAPSQPPNKVAPVRLPRSAMERGESQRPTAKPVTVSESEISEFLTKPPAEQAAYLAASRRLVFNRDFSDPDTLFRARELAAKVRTKLDELEKSPADFAAFQATYINEVIGLPDDAKRRQLQDIIQNAYEKAVAEGLDAPSRPTGEAEADAWARRRDALDRAATKQVQALLTPEERQGFDRAFLGVVGIDLGIGDGASHRFTENNGQTIVFPSEEIGRKE